MTFRRITPTNNRSLVLNGLYQACVANDLLRYLFLDSAVTAAYRRSNAQNKRKG